MADKPRVPVKNKAGHITGYRQADHTQGEARSTRGGGLAAAAERNRKRQAAAVDTFAPMEPEAAEIVGGKKTKKVPAASR